jgi:hypothetical protein
MGLKRAMHGFALILLGLGLSAAACAASSSDYTPPIRVVPGAAARSMWIASKNKGATDAEAAEPSQAEGTDGGAEEASSTP